MSLSDYDMDVATMTGFVVVKKRYSPMLNYKGCGKLALILYQH